MTKTTEDNLSQSKYAEHGNVTKGYIWRLVKEGRLHPKQTVSEWAVEHRILSAEASAESGKYNLARAPFQKGWQDAISDPRIHTIVGMTSAQVGKTETFLNNPVGYFIAQDPSPYWLFNQL